MKQIELSLNREQFHYQILIGVGAISAPFTIFQKRSIDKIAVVSNLQISSLYFQTVKDTILASHPKCQVELILIEDGESSKSLENFSEIIDVLIEKQFKRTDMLFALGGGVIGDLTGFSAACYQRGIDFIQIPTSLLAMVDSSVGGKTAINHKNGKNLVGAFHQPLEVRIDTDCLNTLDSRQFNAGMAEIIKIAAIKDAHFFQWLEENTHNIRVLERKSIEQMIYKSCQLKAEIVELDEEEKGQRALLNFGHTFGHALETLSGYNSILHGEAVSIGMVLAAQFAQTLGLLDSMVVTRLINLLQTFELPTTLPKGIEASTMIDSMKLDKKNKSGQLRLILISSLGEAFIKEFEPRALELFLSNHGKSN